MTETLNPDQPSDASVPAFGAGRRLRATEPRYMEVLDFLWEEASVLDRDDLIGWKAMLDQAIVYRMPVCVTRKRHSGESFETATMHFDEDYLSIAFRIRRFVETQAWAADPPTRARRFVTGVRVWQGATPDVFDVTSSLLLVRSADDDYRTDILTAERFDRVRFAADGTPLLRDRKIIADQSTIGTHNLAVFL
ncbi:aromatic-ring-hydroxylating dioxygenase subunit beta [Novosphingobium lentum]|uniref:aromatic-ring-hydroxylating dioxygenase subunit beta n=1 Tax=Novosphingobium lentum TaxID=145287 RepID=UPI00082D2984|nr:aromatic-ring-hydroxylating dioxygenase subunit beta [Novosphingobium lentum]